MIKANFQNTNTKLAQERAKRIGWHLTPPVDTERIRPSGPDGSIVAILPVAARTRAQRRPAASVPWKGTRHCRASPDTSTGREAFPCVPPCPANCWSRLGCPSDPLRRHPCPSISTEWQWGAWVSINSSGSCFWPALAIVDGRRWRARRRSKLGGWLEWHAPWATSVPIGRHCTRRKWSLELQSRCCKTFPTTPWRRRAGILRIKSKIKLMSWSIKIRSRSSIDSFWAEMKSRDAIVTSEMNRQKWTGVLSCTLPGIEWLLLIASFLDQLEIVIERGRFPSQWIRSAATAAEWIRFEKKRHLTLVAVEAMAFAIRPQQRRRSAVQQFQRPVLFHVNVGAAKVCW